MNTGKIILSALQIAAEIDSLGSLQPGESEDLPVIHITDKDIKVDIAVTVTKRAKPQPK